MDDVRDFCSHHSLSLVLAAFELRMIINSVGSHGSMIQKSEAASEEVVCESTMHVNEVTIRTLMLP